jgi:inhibitor of cysteine peptidase
MVRILACLLAVSAGLATACAMRPAPPEPPSNPGPIVPEGERGPVYIDEAELLLMESFPVQVRLQVKGTLPTPCHALKWEVTGPDLSGRIDVTAYSLTDPDQACIQVLEEFEAGIPLGSYEEGQYSVFLNGEQVGEISL